MNIFRKITGVVLAITVMNIGAAAQAHAASIWSFDSLYETIGNIKFVNENTEVSEQLFATVSQTNPVVTKTRTKAPVKTMTVTATAYSSSVDETDDTPFITARGTYVRDGIIAANFLPFGTAVKIPAVYGDKIFVVEDRMNKRFSDRIDLWFPSKAEAFKFGKRTVLIEIVS